MTQIAGLASNRGRNLRHIHDLRPGGATLGVVASNHADAPILDWAEEQGIPAVAVEREKGESRREHESRLVEALEGYDVDIVCLDGYMRVLSETFLDAMPTTLNVHPSLLPSFPGMDAWGDALDAGVSVTGCTVHAVTNAVAEDGNLKEGEVDGGPIVTQESVPVYEGDDEASLKERVLYEGEFKAYPRAVKWFADGVAEVDWDANEVVVDADTADDFPARRLSSDDKYDELRYGENPHQDAAVYRDYTTDEASVVGAPQLNEGAKALSYNNYNDADGALNLIKEFEEPAAAVIKHTNPAGCATAETLADAYADALATDPKSAFGGIVALNRECDAETAELIIDSFKEVVVAPGYTADALDVLTEKKNLRVLDVGSVAPRATKNASGDEPRALGQGSGNRPERFTEKKLVGGRLVQERDDWAPTLDDLEVVTEREPTDEELETMLFAWRVLKHVKSNGILFAKGTETVGLGVGQVSRVDAVNIAGMKAEKDAEGKSAEGSVMASDAFFPFPDGITEAAKEGVTSVIQPGGSVNDEDVIEAANEEGMAMVFTGRRCFRHD